MIESIHIKNFRGIQDGKIDRFSKINLLVGPNNSGKSAVLETIYLTNTASQPAGIETMNARYDARTASRDLLGFDPLERIAGKHLKSLTTNVHAGSIAKRWKKTGWTLHVQSSQSSAPCKVALCTVEPKDEKAFKRMGLSLEEIAAEIDWQWSNGFVDAPHNTGTVTMFWEPSLTYYQASESAWWTKGITPASQHTLLYDVTTSLSHLPFEYFRQMLGVVPGWTHKIAKSFERIFQLKQKFNTTFLQLPHDLSQTQGFIAPEDKVALTIDDYGDGARSAFKMLTPLIALAELATEDEPGVFIWEEPELFQNPQSLGRLLAEVSELIRNKPIQLFIATHSIEVVAQFVRLVNESAVKPEELLAIRLNLQNGQLASSAFNHEEIQQWTAMNLDVRVPQGEVDSPLRFQFKENADAAAED